MKRVLKEAVFIVLLSLIVALVYNAVSPTGLKIFRKRHQELRSATAGNAVAVRILVR